MLFAKFELVFKYISNLGLLSCCIIVIWLQSISVDSKFNVLYIYLSKEYPSELSNNQSPDLGHCWAGTIQGDHKRVCYLQKNLQILHTILQSDCHWNVEELYDVNHFQEMCCYRHPCVATVADYVLLLFIYFYFIFLFTVRSQKLLDRLSQNFQGLCILM